MFIYQCFLSQGYIISLWIAGKKWKGTVCLLLFQFVLGVLENVPLFFEMYILFTESIYFSSFSLQIGIN